MKITFYGGAGVGTGANYLLETKKKKNFVDCGMKQGDDDAKNSNFERFPYDISEISAIFVTHANVDHIGMIPKLVKSGFRGRIISTPPTKDFAGPLLTDSEKLLRDEANKKGRTPPYSTGDIAQALVFWETVHYHETIQVSDFTAEFFDAGHILGSSFISIKAEDKTIVFSGDLGNENTPFIKPLEKIEYADYVLIESTYGGKLHENVRTRKDIIEDLIEDTTKKGGTLLIPAFALERTQEMLFELNELVENRRVRNVPIFVDSPLAITLTEIYRSYSGDSRYFSGAAISTGASGDGIFDFSGLKFTYSEKESKKIRETPNPKIIIAGSGMSHGGRIIFHEREYLSDPKNTILFVGFQSKGSVGRLIRDGAKTVNIFGDDVPVRSRVVAIDGYSAHADQKKLLEWITPMRFSLKKTFVVQGEEESASALAEKIRDLLAVSAEIPIDGETAVL